MITLLAFGIYDIIVGCIGLYGIGYNVPDKYRDTPLEKDYKKFNGKVMLMTGIPCVILYFVFKYIEMGVAVGTVIMLICLTPALIYAIRKEKRFKIMLKDIEQQNP